MLPLTQLWVFLTAVLASGLGSMCGFGGGVFLVPTMSVLLGIPLKTAIAASAISVVVGSLNSASVYLKSDMVNVRLGMLMELTTTVGAILGGLLVVLAPIGVLKGFFAITLYFMAIAMIRQPKVSAHRTSGPDPWRLAGSYYDPALGEDVRYVPQRVGMGMSFSTIAGVISGMLGVGGGPVKMPLINTVMRVPVKAAAATSTFMVGITASVSALIFFFSGLVDVSVTVPAVLGILVGSQSGARLARYVPAHVLLRVLVVILIGLATTILLQAFGISLLHV